VLDGAAASDIAGLQGVARAGDRYQLSANVSVRFVDYGRVRVCTIGVNSDDSGGNRAAILEAAPRWRVPLEYRGDVSPGPGFLRHERICPGPDGPRASWSILTRDQRALTELTLGIMSAAGEHCAGDD
jgi:hypothetical protein